MENLIKIINEALKDEGYNLNPAIEESIPMEENEINDFLCSEEIELQVNPGTYLVHSGQLTNQLLFIMISEDSPSYKPICLKVQDITNYDTIFIKLFI